MSQQKVKKQRDTNIELLRIILMIMIIMIHYLVRGFELPMMLINSFEASDNNLVYIMFFGCIVLAVNCFVFISGFYSIQLKFNNLVSFIAQALFFSILNYSIASFVFPNAYIPLSGVINTLFPISSNHWWFLNIYLGLSILSPIINAGIDKLSKKQFSSIILILIYLQTSFIFIGGVNYLSTSGHSIYSMLVMYLLGRYCCIFEVKIKSPVKLFAGYIIVLLAAFYMIAFTLERQDIAWRLMSYNSVFIVIGAVLFFYMFKSLKIKHNSLINKIATLSFGVYLFHESESMKYVMTEIVVYLKEHINNALIMLLALILISIGTYFLGGIIEKIRVLICKPILAYISKHTIKLQEYIKF